MKAIYKYPLHLSDDEVRVTMPQEAQILAVQTQHEVICLWAIVDPDQPASDRVFRIFGTGHPIPGADSMSYVGTAQMRNGALVWHVFEVT